MINYLEMVNVPVCYQNCKMDWVYSSGKIIKP